MLYFVGLGINAEITCKAKHSIKDSKIFIESYTMPWNYQEVKKKLEEELGKEIVLLERERVESNFLLNLAEKEDVSLLIGGDVFSATTHFSLYHEAIKKGIKVKIFHNSSIFSAIAKPGLSLYKFGYTTTISFWYENYKPTSPIKIVKKNKENGMHSLVLLDLSKGYMQAKTAIDLMRKMEEKENIKVVEELIVISRLGMEGEKITYGKTEDLLNTDLGEPPFSLVVPGNLSEVEKEFLSLFKVKT